MNEFHKKLLDGTHHENKDFENEMIALFTELFEKLEELERIADDYYEKNPNALRGLDGGINTTEQRNLTKKYFKKFDELKKKYNITDK